MNRGPRQAVGLEERIRELHVKAGRSRLAAIDDVLDAISAAGLVDVTRVSATEHGEVLTAAAPA